MNLMLPCRLPLFAAALSVTCVTASALAEPPSPARAPRLERVLVDPAMVTVTPRTLSPAATPPSRTIYMNRCAGGCTIQRGYDDSRTNTSSIVGPASLDEFKWGEDRWQELVQCVRETYSPFNVSVTDQDPGNVPHWEIIVGGTASEAGMEAGVLGVSPWVGQCPEPIIENAITFAFLDDPYATDDLNEMCWIVAQETAHSFGLDHEALANDPMTYIGISGNGPKSRHSFMDEEAPCGAYRADDDGCYCLGTTQNSYQAIMDIFGPLDPTPPLVTITEPADGASLRPGFDISASVDDEQGVGSVDLSIDGTVVQTLTRPPFTFDSPAGISEGSHQIAITATDLQGTPASAQINVNIGPPCQSGDECSGQGDGLTCVAGQCVLGPDVAGGLGTTCTKSDDCASSKCASDSENSYCVESCQLGSDDCPGGFDCIDADGSGLCWPSEGGGCEVGGGSQSGSGSGSPLGAIGLALVLGVVMFRRRRPHSS